MALTQVDQGLLGTNAQYTGFKSRIINGAMVIDQRNAGTSVTIDNSGNTYPADRWSGVKSVAGGGTVTGQQVSDAPAGFKNSIKITTTASATVSGTDYVRLQQRIEGYNVADMGFGASGASTFTVSFWVKSSLTGTFGGAFANDAWNRSYPFTYTINSANTWEQKTVTVAGDTSGTWQTTNLIGLAVYFGLGVGSTYSGTAGAWASSLYISATGATSVIGTLNATWQVTGVQLEKGSTATSFDYRPYGTELQLCQRYCYFVGNLTSGYYVYSAFGSAGATTEADFAFGFPVPMRGNPSLSAYSGSSFRIYDFYSAIACYTPTISSSTPYAAFVYFSVTGASQYRPYALQSSNSVSGLIFSAEL